MLNNYGANQDFDEDRYQGFEKLDHVIIRDDVTREQLEASYVDIMLGELDISHYTELHFQVKYLLEEKKVAVNSILNFYDEKYDTFFQASIELLGDIHCDYDLKLELREFLTNCDKNRDIGFSLIVEVEEETKEFVFNRFKMSDKEIFLLLQNLGRFIEKNNGYESIKTSLIVQNMVSFS